MTCLRQRPPPQCHGDRPVAGPSGHPVDEHRRERCVHIQGLATGTYSVRIVAERTVHRHAVQAVAELAPGLTTNTPNAGQVTISGGFAYGTQCLVDGVDVANNVFGTANNLFIKDALEEYRSSRPASRRSNVRFDGGAVRAISKRGSNRREGIARIRSGALMIFSATSCACGRPLVGAWSLGTPRGASDYPRATTTPSGTVVYSRTFLMSAGVRVLMALRCPATQLAASEACPFP